MTTPVKPQLTITREKCSYANRYKAARKPTCGCRVCITKWNDKKD